MPPVPPSSYVNDWFCSPYLFSKKYMITNYFHSGIGVWVDDFSIVLAKIKANSIFFSIRKHA